MRPLKVRAWDEDANTMIYSDNKRNAQRGVDYDFKINHHGELCCYRLNPKIRPLDNIMLSTGLTDKHGAEIYEGDIVKHNGPFGIKAISWGSSAENGAFKNMASFMIDKTISFMHKHVASEMAIIGNIYESPNLLEE